MEPFLENRKDLRNVNVKDEWRLILKEEQIQQHVNECANKINELFEGKEIILVCILKGAVWFFSDLTKKLVIPYSTYFIEASSYKNSQIQAETIEILSVLNPKKFEGKHVILIDELYDNGTTLEHIKKAISEKTSTKYDDIFTCTLFKKNKPISHPDACKLDLYGCFVPNVWLVGYGLDDQQEKRGWTQLWAAPKSEGIEKTEDDIKVFGKH